MVVKIKRYGWIADLPDHRDLIYAAPMQVLAALPSSADLRSKCPPVYDQGQLGSCLTGDTLVTMADLSEKRIMDIETGERVSNHLGQGRRVTRKYVRNYSGELYRIKVSGLDYEICATAEHPFAVRHNRSTYARGPVLMETITSFVQAKDIDLSSKPRLLLPKTELVDPTQSIIDVRTLLEEELIYDEETETIRLLGAKREYAIPVRLEITPTFMRLLGLFLAEGSYRKDNAGSSQGINFTFSKDETDLVRFVKETIHAVFGLQAEIKQSLKRPSITDVALSNSTVAKLFIKLCGEFSFGKELSPVLFKQPVPSKISLLRGWLEGDGYSRPRYFRLRDGARRRAAEMGGTTISKKLHRGLFRLALSCGLKPSCKIKNNTKFNKCESLFLKFYSSDVLRIFPEYAGRLDDKGIDLFEGHRKYKEDEKNYYCTIESISKRYYENIPVYNLEVETDNVYIANFTLVHNCTANSIAGAVEFDLMKENKNAFMPSRLFIYYNERSMEGTVDSDSGAQIRDGVKSVAGQGDCPEELWPYDINKFADKPPQTCYDEAVKHKAVQYQRVIRDLNQMKGCLASGYPFVFGFAVYQGFESQEVAQTGHASMPSPGEQAIGGHAVLAVGYDDSQNWFIVRNSWGTGWGMNGYFTLPYAYLLNENLSDDFWTIRVVS